LRLGRFRFRIRPSMAKSIVVSSESTALYRRTAYPTWRIKASAAAQMSVGPAQR
jgi:hypothetical protein